MSKKEKAKSGGFKDEERWERKQEQKKRVKDLTEKRRIKDERS